MKKETKPSTVILALVIVGLIAIISLGIDSDDKPTMLTSVLKETMTDEQIVEANEVLKKCGLENGVITRDELLDGGCGEGSLGYRIVKEGYETVMYLKDGIILSIKYADTYYLYNNGEYPTKLADYIITENERVQLITFCQNTLNRILKSPTSAKYPWDYNEWPMKKENGEITIQSYVDAKNSFGTMIRSQFQFKIKDNTITSLIFDGQEYIKK